MNNLNFSNYFTYKDEVSRTISWGHWFLFLNIFLAIFIGCSYLYNSPTPSTGLGIFYLIISWLGHFSCLVSIIYLLIFFPLSFIGNLKLYRILAIILSTILFLIMLVDVKLYQSIKIHINFSVLELFFEQEGFSTGLNFNFLYIAGPILLAIEYGFSSLAWHHIYTKSYQKLSFFISALFLISFLSTHIMHIWADAYKYVPITQQKSLFPAYYPMTANTFLKEHGWIVDVQEDEEIERKTDEKFNQRIQYPLENIRVNLKEKSLNVVMIFVQGISQKYLTKEYMPNLAEFADKHDSYENHFLGGDDPSLTVFEAVYGIPPQYMPILKNSGIPPINSNEMLQQDYKIQSFVTGKISKKIDDFRLISGIRKKQLKSFSTDEETIMAATDFISKWNDRPQMTYISITAPNTLKEYKNFIKKFVPEADYEQITAGNLESNDPKLLNRYYNSLFNTDRLIGNVLNSLKDHLDNTVIIITASKGFSLPTAEFRDNKYDRENFHVPLIISWPDAVISAKITALTGSQDIAPTIAKEVLGIQNDYDTYSTGVNVRDVDSRPWILSGDTQEIRIISENQTTIFDKHGNASIYTDNKTPKSQPNMATLIKAIKILNKFKDK